VSKRIEAGKKTRRQILSAALRVFGERGYSATRLEDVAKEAGISRGPIYWHFSSKENLHSEILKSSLKKYKNRIEKALQSMSGSPLTKIKNLLKELFIMLEDDKEYRDAYSTFIFRGELTGEAGHIYNDMMGGYYREAALTLSDLISEGIEIGEIKPDTDPQLAASALLYYISGVEFAWLSVPELFPVKEAAIDLADAYIRGLANA
jgi:TetR/AcrR family acrAB operon transcriptional repressor